MATAEEIRIGIAKNKATEIFETLFDETERKSKQPILEEVCSQIEVCDGLCRQVNEATMRDWLQSRSLWHLAIQVKTHKFS